MLKKFTFKKIAITSLLLLLAIILYNYPEEINHISEPENKKSIDIYLIDNNNYVALTKKIINDSESSDLIENIINSLIINENNENLPQGFKAIIPEGTKLIDYELKDGLLKINFNKNFLDVSQENENKMIEALIFSLTTIKEVKNIMIFVEGERLLKLPNSNKTLDLYLNRNYGINKIVDINSFHDTSMVTIYYLSKNNDYYYVPVSYISNNQNDKIEIIINNLKSNKLNHTNLLSHLNYHVELMNYEATEQEVLLDFNELLLNSVYNGKLKEEVKYALTYSIHDTLGIENVVFMVNSTKIDEFRLEN